jgi:hypothetical protein
VAVPRGAPVVAGGAPRLSALLGLASPDDAAASQVGPSRAARLAAAAAAAAAEEPAGPSRWSALRNLLQPAGPRRGEELVRQAVDARRSRGGRIFAELHA